MNRKFRRAQGLGPTGTHSRGKMHASDEGDLRMAIGHTASEVVIDFGKPVAWIGLEPDKVEELAKTMLEHVAAIRKGAN